MKQMRIMTKREQTLYSYIYNKILHRGFIGLTLL